LQGPSERQGQDEDDDIADNTDNRVGDQSGGLVETGAALHWTEPVHWDRGTHADLDDESDGVVAAETAEEDVDEPDFAAVRSEDAG
jgi:hypothetical protein